MPDISLQTFSIANNDGAVLCFAPHHALGVFITERLLQFSVKHVAKLNIHTIQSRCGKLGNKCVENEN